ncbi:hypothetical protein [Pedobacter sp. ASV12]|uniref:hypothetical protein n=1 Tax=Pedobacter sp. ASV12 TaxID=2795120 RepID=UPI0018EAE4C9|nr:hypothetical protein [Pedobacter sp. ASV12]
MKFINLLTIGIFIALLGIAMFFWGAYMFTYQGNCTQLMSVTGQYAFFLWLPTILIGLILTGLGIGKRIKPSIKQQYFD